MNRRCFNGTPSAPTVSQTPMKWMSRTTRPSLVWENRSTCLLALCERASPGSRSVYLDRGVHGGGDVALGRVGDAAKADQSGQAPGCVGATGKPEEEQPVFNSEAGADGGVRLLDVVQESNAEHAALEMIPPACCADAGVVVDALLGAGQSRAAERARHLDDIAWDDAIAVALVGAVPSAVGADYEIAAHLALGWGSSVCAAAGTVPTERSEG